MAKKELWINGGRVATGVAVVGGIGGVGWKWYDLVPTTDQPPRNEPESGGTWIPNRGGADEQGARGTDEPEESPQGDEGGDEGGDGGYGGVDPEFDDLEFALHCAPYVLVAGFLIWYFRRLTRYA